MTSRVTVYDKSGILLAELETAVNRSWQLNAAGEARFTMATSDPACRRDVLEIGNLILVQHDKLMPWGGVIETPRVWGDGTVEVSASSGEQLLKYRLTERSVIKKGLPGSLFTALVEQANRRGEVCAPGVLWAGAKEISKEWHYSNVLDEIRSVAEESGGEWWFDPILDNGRLRFKANFAERRGTFTGLWLQEGVNIERGSRTLTEQGKIANVVCAFGQGDAWDKKPTFEASDTSSINRYGLRMGALSVESDAQSGVESAAAAELARTSGPRKIMNFGVLDVGTTFGNLIPGYQYGVMLTGAGFYLTGFGTTCLARLTGMQFDDKLGKVDAVLEEV